MLIGVISDTHGIMRPAALAALKGSDLIVHAGDVGSPSVLESLRKIAPVVAVRGNCDRGGWAEGVAQVEVVEIGEVGLLVLHEVQGVDLAAAPPGIRCVISGHSHKAGIVEKEGILYLNPGSAGPRRFSLPVTLARLEVEGGKLSAKIVALEAEGPR